MSYAEHLAAERRLAVLQLLVEDRGQSNEQVLERALLAMGHSAGMTRAYVRALLTFLETVGCVTIEFFRDQLMVAKITDRGQAVARGSIDVAGIASPQLGG